MAFPVWADKNSVIWKDDFRVMIGPPPWDPVTGNGDRRGRENKHNQETLRSESVRSMLNQVRNLEMKIPQCF